MSGTLYVIQPDGSELVTPMADEPELEVLQAAVGGYIQEVIVNFKGRTLSGYVNEEGAIRGLIPNKHATKLLARPVLMARHTFQNLVGNIAIWVDDAGEGTT